MGHKEVFLMHRLEDKRREVQRITRVVPRRNRRVETAQLGQQTRAGGQGHIVIDIEMYPDARIRAVMDWLAESVLSKRALLEGEGLSDQQV